MSAPVLNKIPGPQIDSAAIERSRPQLPGAPFGGLALGAALLASFLIHGAMLGTVLVASPRPNPVEDVETVTVDLVPETAIAPEKPSPPDKPEPEPEPRLVIPDFNQMFAAQQAVQSPPKPMPAKPASTAAAKQQPASPSPPAAGQGQPQDPPQQPPEQPADGAPPPVTETSPEDALAAAARIADLMHLPELAALGAFNGTPSDTKAKLSADEIAAFRAEIRQCWTAPGDTPAKQNPKVFIRVTFKPNGTFSAQPEILGGSPTAFAVLQAARQALTQCQPYRSLPSAKYKEWRLLDLEFTAKDGPGISPIANVKTPPKP